MQQTARRTTEEEQGESESFLSPLLSALERVHGIQKKPFVCDSSRRNWTGRRVACSVSGIATGIRLRRTTTEEFERAARSHARRSRCAALLFRRPGHVRDFAGRPGGGLHIQRR